MSSNAGKKGHVAGSLLLVLVVAFLFASYLAFAISPSYQTQGSTVNQRVGLKLSATLNATNLRVGHGIDVVASEINIHPYPNNVTVEGNFPLTQLMYPSCGLLPVNVGVFPGYYDSGNISSAPPPNASMPYCPEIAFLVHYYVFEPNSSAAMVWGSGGNYTAQITYSTSLDGCYCGINGSLVPYASGSYTVLVQDEWGSVAILHFKVS